MTLSEHFKAFPITYILVGIGFITALIQPLIPITIFSIYYLYSLSKKERVVKYKHNYEYVPTVKSGQLMSHSAKVAYLQSPEWKEKVAQVKARDGYKCVVTGATTQLEVHHITYERLGNEDLSDLVTVTREVHQRIHDKLGYSRNTIYPVSAYFL
jgi:predicted metallopeptidase